MGLMKPKSTERLPLLSSTLSPSGVPRLSSPVGSVSGAKVKRWLVVVLLRTTMPLLSVLLLSASGSSPPGEVMIALA
jgi:hypothetical protein